MRRKLAILALVLGLLSQRPAGQAPLPVVPGAFGFGMNTRAAYACGSNPVVYRVNTLADNTADVTNPDGTHSSSFRAALEASGPRVVIFETSGNIPLGSDVVATNPCLTIAGQTAPNPGITIQNFGPQIYTHDVLMQHLRVRAGDGPPLLPQTADHDGAIIYGGTAPFTDVYNVVFDHNSISWAQDKNTLSGSIPPNSGVTYWRNIFSEALYHAANVIVDPGQPSSLGMLLKQSYVGVPANFSVIQNLFAHNSDRNPEIQGPDAVQFLNNIVYDWGTDTTAYPWATFLYSQDPSETGPSVDVIGNLYIAGQPPTPFTPLYAVGTFGGPASGPFLYMSDNLLDQTVQPITDYVNYLSYDPRVVSPPVPLIGVTVLPSAQTKSTVEANAGARPLNRDSVDTRVIASVNTYTGTVISSQNQVGGWPALAVNVRALTLPANPNTVTPSGYTNLELWLQGFASALEPGGPGPVTWNITCPGGDLQATINSANLGDTINLGLGPTAICTGNYVLPAKIGSGTLTIQSASIAALPAGIRVTPAQAISLAKIQTPNSAPAIATGVSAANYLLRGLDVSTTSGATNDLITFGDGSSVQTSLSQVPTNLVIDRSYLHGHATLGTKRGVALNSASTSITNSTLTDFKLSGQDAQAIAGWNGPGPFTITNNDIEGSGNNILFGGADASIPNLIPSDITITGNYLTKPLAWRGVWTVKNVLELKNAQRLTIDSNVFENNWLDAQTGIAILFTVANQDGSNTWADVAHVTFTNNVIRHAGGGFNISGWSFTPGHDSQIMSDVTIQNNLIYDISSATWGGNGYDVLIGHKPDTVTFRHNTFINTDSVGIIATAEPSTNFVAKDNLFAAPSYPIFGDNGVGPGNPAVAAYFPGSTWLDNAWAASVGSYPAMNYTPADIPTIRFQNYAGGNYRLASNSPFIHAASDGGAVGVNIDALPTAANLPPNQPLSLVVHLGALLGVGP